MDVSEFQGAIHAVVGKWKIEILRTAPFRRIATLAFRNFAAHRHCAGARPSRRLGADVRERVVV
jgi:hypothetical protein